jgi:nitrate reductase gamma subunit
LRSVSVLALVLLCAAPVCAQEAASKSADATSSASTSEGAHPAAPRGAGLDLYNLLLGPAFVAAWVLFVAGFVWRFRQYNRVTRRFEMRPITAPRAAPDDRAVLLRGVGPIGRAFSDASRWLRGTVFTTHPVMGVLSLIFHLVLFLAPLTLPAHAILLKLGTGVGLPTFSEPFVDRLTVFLLIPGAFFLLRRLLIPRVRALTTIRDYLILLLVAAPFVTGYLAYHQVLPYKAMLLSHMFLGEVLIGAIPFTKLGHMPFLIFARFFTAGEYSWRPANRRW